MTLMKGKLFIICLLAASTPCRGCYRLSCPNNMVGLTLWINSIFGPTYPIETEEKADIMEEESEFDPFVDEDIENLIIHQLKFSHKKDYKAQRIYLSI